MINAQVYLDRNYPKKERKEEKKLNLASRGLKGDLKLEGFDNLECLDCAGNFLTSIDLTTLKNPEKLKYLRLTSNNLSESDLTCFSMLTNLEKLYISN